MLPAGLTRIGERAFARSSLERIILPEGVEEIGADAFPEDAVVYVFGDGAGLRDRGFNLVTCALSGEGTVCITGYYGSRTEIEIPEGLNGHPVTRIGDGAFSGNTDLEYIEFPSTLTQIGDEAFCGCGSLKGPYLPLGLTDIGDRAFYGVNGIAVSLPRSVTHIGEDAFTGYRYINAYLGTYSAAWACEIQEQDPSVTVVTMYLVRIMADTAVAVEGQQVTCTALLMEEDLEAFQWQWSPDGSVWTDCPGVEGVEYTFTASEETCGWYRVVETDFTGTYYNPAVLIDYFRKDIAIRTAYVCGTDISLNWTKAPEGVLYTLRMTGPDGVETVVAENLWDPFFDVTGLDGSP